MTEKRRQNKLVYRGIFAVCLLLFSVCAFRYVAKADIYLLGSSGERLLAGETLTISDYFVPEEAQKVVPESLQYAVSDKSEDAGCISLSPDGTVMALAGGSAVVEITYQITEDLSPRTEEFYITVIAPEKVEAIYGEKIWLAAFDLYNPYREPDAGDGEGNYTYSFSNDSLILDEGKDGILVQGFQNAEVYLEKGSAKILVAEITVNIPKFQCGKMARALGTGAFFPKLLNCSITDYTDNGENVIYLAEPVWSVENEKVVTLSESGFLAVSKGSAKIKASFTAKNGDTLELTLPVTVTDPKLTEERLVLASGVIKKIPVSGGCSASTYSSQKDVYVQSAENKTEDAPSDRSEYRYAQLALNGKLKGFKEGTEKITFYVDGKKFTLSLVITDPQYKKNTFTMYKGLKKTLPISGLNKKYSTISYTSAKPDTASITKAGYVTAKKVGTVKIKIKADGKSFNVWVEVAAKKAYQAAKREIAISKTKTKYSQIKRMMTGFYDCSSLVSRVYRKFGVYFGSKSGWSPTAAGIGQWCSSHHKVIASKAVDYTKLVPGDLVFYSYTKNGRYKNISHIEMYVGNGMSVSASSSRNAVVHYGYGTSSIVMIARPLK